ncbi:MAG: hypothetical protein EAZ89_02950 [Bacteroidetes bacterium]|nr:MAG: hypothetical protein EAZ89_02950 [Bacteroidota bacterium]
MSTEFKDIVSLTGSPGLHKIVKADGRGVVVESLDEKRKRQLVKGNMMVSKLTDVSIFTTEESEALVNVFKSIHDKYAGELPVDKSSSNKALLDFMADVLPTFDGERVYASNVKKLIGWYAILVKEGVEFALSEETEAGGEPSDEAVAEEVEEAAAE